MNEDWTEAEVRFIPPGGAPGAHVVAVLERKVKEAEAESGRAEL